MNKLQSTITSSSTNAFDSDLMNVFFKSKGNIEEIKRPSLISAEGREEESTSPQLLELDKHKGYEKTLSLETYDRKGLDNELSELFERFGEIKPEIEYFKRLNKHIESVIANKGTALHDVKIVLSQALSFVVRKLIRHPGDEVHKDVAKKVIAALYDCGQFQIYLQNTLRFKEILPWENGIRDKDYSENMAKKAIGKIEDQIKNQKSEAENAAKKNAIGIWPKKRRIVREYLSAAFKCIQAKKPPFAPFESRGERINHHSHGINNYFLNHITQGALPWQVKIGNRFNIKKMMVMPIPHRVTKSGKCGHHEEHCAHGSVAGELTTPIARSASRTSLAESNSPSTSTAVLAPAYYADHGLGPVLPTSYDYLQIEAFNVLGDQDKAALTLAATGFDLKQEGLQDRLVKFEQAAHNFARNFAAAKIASGQQHIKVVFGEITANKTQLEAKLPGLDGPDTLKSSVVAIQQALIKGAEAGIESAVMVAEAESGSDKNPKAIKAENIKAQIHIVLHSDTEKEKTELEVNHTQEKKTILQPTITDLFSSAKEVDSWLSGRERTRKFEIGHILQVAHLFGVTPKNYKEQRTAETIQCLESAREFKKLRVVADTSWLTAAARNANYGMGTFLSKHPSNPRIREIGRSMIFADRISNDGFMFFSEGERYFQQQIDDEDFSAENIFGLAVMRAALEKTSQSYNQELGNIFEKIKKPDIAEALIHAIKEEKDGVIGDGNFIGMLLKLYEGHNNLQGNGGNIQDAVPFVWGADDLTQYNDRSGVEKNKLYNDQFICGALIEMLIANLPKGAGSDQEKLVDILRQMRMGPDRDIPFWKEPITTKISLDGITDDPNVIGWEALPNHDISAASVFVEPGKEPVKTDNEPYQPLWTNVPGR